MTLSGRVLAGSKKTKGERKSDFYPTPTKATRKLLSMIEFRGSILEPACGKGHISKVLISKGYSVESYDKENRGYGYKKDFFTEDRQFRNIITNFPFRGMQSFIEHSKRIATFRIAAFSKLVFLESQERYKFFQDREFPLATVYVFSERITLALDEELERGGTIAYAWFLWQKGWLGEPTIKWISPY